MVDLDIGRHGLVILLILFAVLGAEDVLIWVNSGVVPAVEFFLATLLVLIVVAVAIRESMRHAPPDQ